jgi:hypothetical protein
LTHKLSNALRDVAEAAPPVAVPPGLFDRARRFRPSFLLVPATAVSAVVAFLVATAGTAPQSAPPSGRVDGNSAPATGKSAPAVEDTAPVVLRLAAQQVENAPAQAVGRYIYTRTRGEQLDGNGQWTTDLNERWQEPAGMIPVRIKLTSGNGEVSVHPDARNPKDGLAEENAADRAELRRDGPSLRLPTREFLAGLPTDPQRLLAFFRANAEGSAKRSQDQEVFLTISDLFRRADPIMTPRLRGALYRTLALLPGLVRVPGTVDLAGRSGIAVGLADLSVRDDLILDKNRLTVIGQRVVSLKSFDGIPAGSVLYLSTVDHKAVNRVGETS